MINAFNALEKAVIKSQRSDLWDVVGLLAGLAFVIFVYVSFAL